SFEKYNKPGTLFISAGSSAAPFCLALAKSTGNKSAVVMTPSIFGTKPFDYAIVPEHDSHDKNDKKVLTTLGAPNHIFYESAQESAKNFFAGQNFSQKVVAVLVGGDDANYQMNVHWARQVLGDLKRFTDATILITTSRRTDEFVENAVEDLFMTYPSTGYLLIFSRNPKVSAVTAMLGAATHVIVTEDSVSMVSEAVTAGFRVGLLRVPRNSGKIKKLFGYGTQRFDAMFEKMKAQDLLVDFGNIPDFDKFLESPEQKHGKDFNEAKRAAEWILGSN
ncbi:MAG: mitochondrial fission ELM1 family protein, partial [Synergistaceae bacterium]|nr:mitochondrial fission ELM1 family protein [Synergistaceae bacterium]